MNKFLSGVLLTALVAGSTFTARAGESKYASTSSGTNNVVTFGPTGPEFPVTGLYAKSDKSTSVVKFFTKGGSGRTWANTAATSGAQVVSCNNGSYGLTTNDLVVYVHSDGTLLRTYLSDAATGSVTLATGLTKAGTTNDSLYEIGQSFELPLGATSLNPNGIIFTVPPDSPLVMVSDCNTNGSLAVNTGR